MLDAAQLRGPALADSALESAAGPYGYDTVSLPATEVQIGGWRVASKQAEHVVLSASGTERKLRLEVMQVGTIRRLELDFDDLASLVVGAEGAYEGDGGLRLVVRCVRPPRFSKQASHGAASLPRKGGSSGGQRDYIHTADFTQGNASQVDTHAYSFAPGALEDALPRLRALGLAFERERAPSSQHAPSAAATEAAAAALARRPRPYVPYALNATVGASSPRLQVVALAEQLEREMRQLQARYSGICPVRAGIYEAVFAELLALVRKDEPKRGALLERVRAEAAMTIAAYGGVFEHSIAFGSAKLEAAIDLKEAPERQLAQLAAEIEVLQAEAAAAAALVETLELRAAEERSRSVEKPAAVLELESSNAMLEQLLDVNHARAGRPAPRTLAPPPHPVSPRLAPMLPRLRASSASGLLRCSSRRCRTKKSRRPPDRETSQT